MVDRVVSLKFESSNGGHLCLLGKLVKLPEWVAVAINSALTDNDSPLSISAFLKLPKTLTVPVTATCCFKTILILAIIWPDAF